MKKLFIGIISAIFILSAACSLTACGKVSDIGVLMPDSLQRWVQDGENLKKEFKAKGYSVDLQYANNDVTAQVNQIENMIEKKVKALVIAPVSGYSLNKVLEQAKESGILIIAYDRLLMNTADVDYYVAFNNFNLGEAQGKYIEEVLKLNDESTNRMTFNIEFIQGDPSDGNGAIFFHGAMNILEKYMKTAKNPEGKLICQSGQTTYAQITTERWSSEYAQVRFENIIMQYYSGGEKLHAVLAANDSTALGVTNALKLRYNVNADDFPVITGQDCDIENVKNIIAGFQSMSIFKYTLDMAAKAVEVTVAAIEGEPISTMPANDNSYNGEKKVETYVCDLRIITKDNYKTYLIDTGYYSESDLL